MVLSYRNPQMSPPKQEPSRMSISSFAFLFFSADRVLIFAQFLFVARAILILIIVHCQRPLSRHRAQRAKHDSEDGNRQHLDDPTRQPRSDRAPTLHRQPAPQPPSVADFRLVRNIRARTIIVIIHVYDPFYD